MTASSSRAPEGQTFRGVEETMQIAVHAIGMSLPAQTRAYLEYRMFSAVSGLDLRSVRMNVRLEEYDLPRMGAQCRCSVVLTLGTGGRIRVRATGDRVYLAIDRAAKSLSRNMEHDVATGRPRRNRGGTGSSAVSQGAERESES